MARRSEAGVDRRGRSTAYGWCRAVGTIVPNHSGLLPRKGPFLSRRRPFICSPGRRRGTARKPQPNASRSDVELCIVALTCWFTVSRSAVGEPWGESGRHYRSPANEDQLEPRRVVMVLASRGCSASWTLRQELAEHGLQNSERRRGHVSWRLSLCRSPGSIRVVRRAVKCLYSRPLESRP